MLLTKRVDIGEHMRTITKKLSARLKAQAQEANVMGLKKLGNHLMRLSEAKTRATGSSYVYSETDLKQDVETSLWNAMLRIADYYDCNIDAEFTQHNVEKLSELMRTAISKHAGISHGVGVYEPIVPGEEVVEEVLIEVD